MDGRETKLEFGNWSIVIIFGYGDIKLSVVSVYCCCRRPYELTICAMVEMNRGKSIGPTTDPCVTPMVYRVTEDVEQPIRRN